MIINFHFLQHSLLEHNDLIILVKAPDEGKPSKNHFGWPPV